MGADGETYSQTLGEERAQIGNLHQTPSLKAWEPHWTGVERIIGAEEVKETRRTWS